MKILQVVQDVAAICPRARLYIQFLNTPTRLWCARRIGKRGPTSRMGRSLTLRSLIRRSHVAALPAPASASLGAGRGTAPTRRARAAPA